MTNAYDVGTVVRITATFADANDTNVDPDSVICKYRDPSDNTTTLTYGTDAELIKSATGVYYTDIDVDEAGSWIYRFEGTGANAGADEGKFTAITYF